MNDSLYFSSTDIFFDILLTIIFLVIWHFFFQIPKQYMLIEGRIESCNLARKRLRKKITFIRNDGTKIAFNYLFLTKGLCEQIGHYTPTSLSGRFCLMKQFGFTHLFAFADHDSAIALSRDMYFPKTLSTILLKAVKYFLITMFIAFLMQNLLNFGKTLLSFFIIYAYFIYFNLISNYPKKIYTQQLALLKKAKISEPTI